MKGAKLAVVLGMFLALVLLTETARSRKESSSQNSFRRAASGFYQTLSNIFGEENIRALYKFFSKTTERFVHGVDSFLDTLWKLWVDLLDVMGIDCKSGSHLCHIMSAMSYRHCLTSNLTHYFTLLVAYWFLSLFLSGFFYILHAVFGRFFWLARVALFALSCLYILQKFEGDPEKAVLPLCFIMAVYFMTGPVGAYWRKGGGSGTLEEKIDQLDTQIRLLNIRLSRVIENLERSSDQ
ncbi:hypothetical protein PO909_026389 [Leuciscus waleckii]